MNARGIAVVAVALLFAFVTHRVVAPPPTPPCPSGCSYYSCSSMSTPACTVGCTLSNCTSYSDGYVTTAGSYNWMSQFPDVDTTFSMDPLAPKVDIFGEVGDSLCSSGCTWSSTSNTWSNNLQDSAGACDDMFVSYGSPNVLEMPTINTSQFTNVWSNTNAWCFWINALFMNAPTWTSGFNGNLQDANGTTIISVAGTRTQTTIYLNVNPGSGVLS